MIGNRIYVKATARLRNSEGEEIETVAFSREEETKKGMDPSQITGAASSYARKYALNGMFCIDDTKDSDATNNGQSDKPARQETKQPEDDQNFYMAMQEINAAQSRETLASIYNNYTMLQTDKRFLSALSAKKLELAKA